MNRLLWLFAIFACTLSGLTRAGDSPTGLPPDANMELFLLAGQSNMAGRGVPEAQDKIADPHVWVLNDENAWVPAIDPLHYDKVGVDGVGPGRSFGIELANAHPGAYIGLIPTAVGGVSLDMWKPGGKLYTTAIAHTRAAQKHGTLTGILWHQGESDTKPAKVESYSARLDKLMDALRHDLDAPSVPVVVGELGVFDPVKNAPRIGFNAMIAKYPQGHTNVACVDSHGLKSIGDNTHFDAASQRELGRRYAEDFLKLQSLPKDKP